MCRFGRYKLILFSIILHLHHSVYSMDSNNSMPSASNNNTPAMPHLTVSNNTGKADAVQLGEKTLIEVMAMCNASYQIPISYMDEMNVTGSYPDETEKIPMCFMKCYMENVGAITADNTIKMEQAKVHFGTNDDVITSCFKELSEIDNLDQCEYAYFLARCIMMVTLVDNRKSEA
ncbi:uncharacterized protein LOC119071706 [Bradysia coprophila]|uniref:uncharacterized protein LOC119071706 n=1 Tax=Bradysia coprophila TaxID=38358 RepID=UPI00187D7B8E|nr:uncharacterized protein LOC119071706 [Bradysia coprophila]